MFHYATTVLNLDVRSVLSIFQFAEMYVAFIVLIFFCNHKATDLAGLKSCNI